MITGKQIKIIKRAARHGPLDDLAEKGKATTQDSGGRAQRDAFMVVTGWVRELRQKRGEEAALGFKRLFGNAA